jgi:16S rRNA (guanine527-N7)-methyltransferase
LVAPLQGYLELLDRWNRIHALTSLPAAARWTELVLDSSALLSHLETLPPGSLVVDLGTGMGMPAVVLALARPDLNVLGVDSTRKKIAFLRQVALELGIRNLEPECARFEDLPCLEADVGVAKALAPLDRLLAWWDPLGKPGAPFLALKGPGDPGPPPRGWKLTNHPYELPGRGARQVIEARRTA